MDVVRNLERRLERLVEGFAGKVFRGQLHPVELAARLTREADLALRNTEIGPVAPNVFTVHVNRVDLGDDRLPSSLSAELAAYLYATAVERGWLVEGPTQVHVEIDDSSPVGTIRCLVDWSPGPLQAWGFLLGNSDRISLRRNRVTVGRASINDVVLDNPKVSRRHAMIWREAGSTWIRDLGSSNGTTIDGRTVTDTQELQSGSVVGFGSVAFSFKGA